MKLLKTFLPTFLTAAILTIPNISYSADIFFRLTGFVGDVQHNDHPMYSQLHSWGWNMQSFIDQSPPAFSANIANIQALTIVKSQDTASSNFYGNLLAGSGNGITRGHLTIVDTSDNLGRTFLDIQLHKVFVTSVNSGSSDNVTGEVLETITLLFENILICPYTFDNMGDQVALPSVSYNVISKAVGSGSILDCATHI